MKHPISILTTVLAVNFAFPAAAQSYCEALLDADALNARYARVAPIYSDAASGWMFADDQLNTSFAMKQTAQKLVTDIVGEFDRRGVKLAILLPPPRPVVAGKSVLSKTVSDNAYDVGLARKEFATLIDDLRQTGAIVPDLQTLALNDPELRRAFYFKRDTHWTPRGALASALSLADKLRDDAVDLSFPRVSKKRAAVLETGRVDERGSLADIARNACKVDLGAETAAAYDLSFDSGASLLGNTSDLPRVALVGTSFSDRYKRDHYRVADALSWALEAEVDNYSISGGGAAGAIEAYVLSGELGRGAHDLVIWEVPYTESFNSTSNLRQILGALRLGAPIGGTKNNETEFVAAGLSFTENCRLLRGIELVTDPTKDQKFKLRVEFDDGHKTNVSLRRRGSVPVAERNARMFTVLNYFGARVPIRVEVVSEGTSVVTEIIPRF